MNLNDDITTIKGIGPKTAAPFRRAGIFYVYDLLTYYPSTYKTYPEVSAVLTAEEGESAAICAPVKNIYERCAYGKTITTAALSVMGLSVNLVWFNQRYLKRSLKPGIRYVFYGRVSYKGRTPELVQPQYFTIADYQKKVGVKLPVYPKVFGLTDKLIEKAVRQVLSEVNITEYLSDDILEKYQLLGLPSAFNNIHFPENSKMLSKARERIAFDEFFMFLLSHRLSALEEEKVPNTLGKFDTSICEKIKASLPYKLTKGQDGALNDLLRDFNGKYITQRLIQGDVGSGKTIVAFCSMAVMAYNGYTSAIMAPTEVLANQHYQKLLSLTKRLGLEIPTVLLTGHVKGKARREALEQTASGVPSFVVGTHALFQEKVQFKNLALVITDEQHRFGVKQRNALIEKGRSVFSVVMSATPIPRTLSLILYQGMNISTITEKPSVRKPLKNAVIDPSLRKNAYALFVREVRAGHQGIIICPLVEPSENAEGENVEEYYEKLKNTLPSDITIGKLYGPMSSEKKDAVMSDFASGKTDILVSTTVIEVGVDVPNATVIMIEDAQKFGLAQLHQLRGRVGRGDAQAYCMFVDTSGSKTPSKRLEVLKASNDGFYIANADLKMRGPGDAFGVRQSGDIAFKIADIYNDSALLAKASECVEKLLSEDPELKSMPELKKFLTEESERSYSNL
ncbi:MAG: ATP-dependent DNA helicase RecG [Lachnospiraceae bacterium]|uniref:Probable DNA 3'-5' helicase RecG n=1 Tax=Candidatus Weimeria bifida TaxID=2599074 RepID=A0A6N7IYQ2_9FIRM|nr:ATP-dependent DNA helicase RecG [Candidatus Weimeria bifida]RRF95377.1 MAG: ATP-dependent DNA helicase RecG [Lachnospiraceae bacterium]